MEPVEHFLVLADILADYEEFDDTPVAPRWSPFLPSIALDVATFSSFSAYDSVALESPRAMMATTRIEPPIDEHELPASFLPSPNYLATSDPWSTLLSPLSLSDWSLVELSRVAHKSPSPLLPSKALGVETFGSVSPSNLTTLGPPLATIATPSEEALQDEQPSCPECGSYTASPDIELSYRYPEAATTPGPGSETSTGMRTTDNVFKEEEWPSDGNADEISSSTGTTIPGVSLAKYSASTSKPFPRPPTLATRYNRDSTVPTNPRQYTRSSPMLSGFCANYRPAIYAAFRDPLAPWSLDDGILDSLPKAPPSLQSHPPASGTAETQILSLAPRLSPSPDVASHPVLPSTCPLSLGTIILPVSQPFSSAMCLTDCSTTSTAQGLVSESHHESHSLSLDFCASNPFISPSTPRFDCGAGGTLSRENERLPDKDPDEQAPRSAIVPGPAIGRNRGSMVSTTTPEASPRMGALPVPLFRDPRHHLGLSPTFVGSCATCLPPFNTAFRAYLIFWYLSLLDNGTLAPLPPMLSPLSQSHQLALGLIRTGALPIANLTGDKGPNTHWVHGENIEIPVNM